MQASLTHEWLRHRWTVWNVLTLYESPSWKEQKNDKRLKWKKSSKNLFKNKKCLILPPVESLSYPKNIWALFWDMIWSRMIHFYCRIAFWCFVTKEPCCLWLFRYLFIRFWILILTFFVLTKISSVSSVSIYLLFWDDEHRKNTRKFLLHNAVNSEQKLLKKLNFPKKLQTKSSFSIPTANDWLK